MINDSYSIAVTVKNMTEDGIRDVQRMLANIPQEIRTKAQFDGSDLNAITLAMGKAKRDVEATGRAIDSFNEKMRNATGSGKYFQHMIDGYERLKTTIMDVEALMNRASASSFSRNFGANANFDGAMKQLSEFVTRARSAIGVGDTSAIMSLASPNEVRARRVYINAIKEGLRETESLDKQNARRMAKAERDREKYMEDMERQAARAARLSSKIQSAFDRAMKTEYRADTRRVTRRFENNFAQLEYKDQLGWISKAQARIDELSAKRESLRQRLAMSTGRDKGGNLVNLISEEQLNALKRNLSILDEQYKRYESLLTRMRSINKRNDDWKRAQTAMDRSGQLLQRSPQEIFANMSNSKLELAMQKTKSTLDRYHQMVLEGRARLAMAMQGVSTMQMGGKVVNLGSIREETASLTAYEARLSKLSSTYADMQRQQARNIAQQQAFSESVAKTEARINSLLSKMSSKQGFDAEAFKARPIQEQQQAIASMESEVQRLIASVERLKGQRLSLAKDNMDKSELSAINAEIDKMSAKYRELTGQIQAMSQVHAGASRAQQQMLSSARDALSRSHGVGRSDARSWFGGLSAEEIDKYGETIVRKVEERYAQLLAARVRLAAAMSGKSSVEFNGQILSVGSIQEETAAVERLSASLSKLKQTQDIINGLQSKNVKQTWVDAKNSASSYLRELQSINNGMRHTQSIAADLRNELVNLFSLYGIKSFLQNVVDIGGQFEYQRKAIATILQSEVRANDLFEQVKALGLKSPYSTLDLDKYVKQMSAFEIPYSQLFEKTKKLADIAAGAGADMSRIILAYGHVKAGGYLTGIQNRQFTNANINMVGGLAKYYSDKEGRIVSVKDVYKRMEERQVTYADMDAVLMKMAEPGGQFYNMQEEMANTTKAVWKNLGDAVNHMYNGILNSSGGLFNFVGKSLTALVDHLEKTPGLIYALATAYGTLKIARMANVRLMGQEVAGFMKSATALENRRWVAGVSQVNQGWLDRMRNGRKFSSSTYKDWGAIIQGGGREGIMLKQNILGAAQMGKLNKDAVQYLRSMKLITRQEYEMAMGLTRAGKSGVTAWGRMGVALRGVGLAIKSVWASLWPMLAITAVFEGFSMLYDWFNDTEAKEANKAASDRLADSLSRLKAVMDSFKDVNVSTLELPEVVNRINELVGTLREETGNSSLIFSDIFAKDENGNYLKNEREQLEALIETLKLVEKAKKDASNIINTKGIDAEFTAEDADDYVEKIQKAWKGKLVDMRYVNQNAFSSKEQSQFVKNLNEQGMTLPNAFTLESERNRVLERLRDEAKRIYDGMKDDATKSEQEKQATVIEIMRSMYGDYNSEFLKLVDEGLAQAFNLTVSSFDAYKQQLPQWLQELQNVLDNNVLKISMEFDYVSIATDALNKDLSKLNDLKKKFDEWKGGKTSTMNANVYDFKWQNYVTRLGGAVGNTQIGSSEYNMAIAARDYQTSNQALINQIGYDASLSHRTKRSKSGSKKKEADTWLEQKRQELDAYKRAYQTYKQWASEFGKQVAREKMMEHPEFKSLFSAEEWQTFDYDTFANKMQSILDANAGAFKSSPERRRTYMQYLSEQFSETLTKMKEDADNFISNINEIMSDRKMRFDLFEQLYNLTGNEGMASVFAYGNGGMSYKRKQDYLVEQFDQEIQKNPAWKDLSFAVLSGYSEEDWKNQHTELRNFFKSVRDEVRSLEASQAGSLMEILTGGESYEQQLNRLDNEYDKKLRDLQPLSGYVGIGSSAVQHLINPAKERLDAERAYKKAQLAFKQYDFSDGILSDNEKLKQVLGELKRTLEEAFKTGAISAEEYRSELRKILDLQEKMAKGTKSGFFAFMKGGIPGLRDFMKARYLDAKEDAGRKPGDQKYTKEERDSIIEKYESLFGADGNQGLGKVSNFLEGKFLPILGMVSGTLEGLQGVANEVRDTFAALGNEKAAWTMDRVSDSIGVGMSFAQPVSDLVKSAMSGDVGGVVKNAIMAPVRIFTDPIQAIAAMHDKKLNHSIELSKRKMAELADKYEAVRLTLSRIVGITREYENGLTENYESLKGQLKEADRQLSLARKKKKVSPEELRELEKQQRELADKVKWYWYDQMKDMYGIDFKNWAEQLASALQQAFEKGEDAALAFKKSVGDIIRELAKNMVSMNILGPLLDKVQNKYFGEGGLFNNKTSLSDSDIQMLISDLTSPEMEAGVQSALSVSQALDRYYPYSSSDDGGSGLSISGQSLTEETGGIIAAYLNGIRADVSFNRMYMERIVQEGLPVLGGLNATAQSQLAQLQMLCGHAERIARAVDDIYALQHGVTLGVRKFYVG